MFGWMLRAKFSKTRCWYCISVANLAAWNRCSPFHSLSWMPSDISAPGFSHWLTKAGSLSSFGQDHLLQVPDQPVVFRVENVMNGGQADILIPASVAGDVVGIEQLIVVVAARIRPVKVREADLRVAVRDLAGRNGIMGDVVQKGVSGADRAGGADGIGGVAFCQDVVERAWQCRQRRASRVGRIHELQRTKRP